MLINKYQESYQFSEYHEIAIESSAEKIYPLIKSINFRKSKLINLLFTLRGLPQKMDSIDGFVECGFIILEERENEEIVIGFLFGVSIREIKTVSPGEFINFNDPRYIKGVWNFRLSSQGHNTILSTETRVFCPTRTTKMFFSMYWFVISYFSGLIRKIILKLVKQEIEEATTSKVKA